MKKNVIAFIIIVILLAVGFIYYLKPCTFIMSKENQEVCYMKSALKTRDSNICSNIKTIYREKRCTDLLKSNDTQEIESVLKSL
jgi:hypothetical protein